MLSFALDEYTTKSFFKRTIERSPVYTALMFVQLAEELLGCCFFLERSDMEVLPDLYRANLLHSGWAKKHPFITPRLKFKIAKPPFNFHPLPKEEKRRKTKRKRGPKKNLLLDLASGRPSVCPAHLPVCLTEKHIHVHFFPKTLSMTAY